jgi:hypothetical protein
MQANEKQQREQLKSLSFGLVSAISRLLGDKGFGDRPIDIVEALIFGMFLTADTYALAHPEKDRAIALINAFYEDMQDYFIKRIIIKDYQVTEAAEIEALAAKFYDLSRSRFAEYGEKFQQDLADPMERSCRGTAVYLMENLFIDPLSDEDKLKLVRALSDRILSFWTACVQSFRQNTDATN